MRENADQRDPLESSLPRICSLNDIQIGETYRFDPPLAIVSVTMQSQHRLSGYTGHADFLKDEIFDRGLVKGTLVHITDVTADERRGYFSCEAKFYNQTTEQHEVCCYTASCKFRKETIKSGIIVDVRKLAKDTLRPD